MNMTIIMNISMKMYGDMKLNGATEDKDMPERFQQIYKRLKHIDAYSAES